MARKKPADAAKAKAAKQKKMVIGLSVFLVLAMAYAVHTMMALNGGGGTKPVAAPVAAATTTPVVTPAVATPTAAPTLAGSPLAAAPVAAAPTDTSGLISAVKPTADTGQLESFSRFESKDPFANGSASGAGGSTGTGTTGSSGTTGSGAGSGGSTGSGTTTPPKVPPAPPTPPAPAPTSAVISVNNTPETVASGATFPTANPNAAANGLFQLRSLTATTATVAIVGGSYSSGSQTLTLKVNKPVTLVNTADGTRYTLMLSTQGTAISGTGGASAAAPATPVVPATTPTPAAP
ncbi:MAG: hypothetical protein QOI27_844 [Gaiellaceae bacterium]|nr:hypothetical protein [Gaiellaceae bacterium]MDX6469119.1 hypothetical protein [Gaiellaceae bacterium]